MKSIIDDVVEGTSITRQTGNTLTQNVTKPFSTTGVGDILEELCQQLHDKINFEISGASGDSTAPTFRGNNTRVDD